MITIRRKMIKYFLLITCIAWILSVVLQLVFDQPLIVTTRGERSVELELDIGTLLYEIVILAVSGFVFFLIMKKEIRKESERQTHEKDLLYAAIAHDLKTPMTSVKGFAKALYDGKIKPEDQHEIFDIIYRKSNSMNEMVNTLFDYAKLGTEEYELNCTELDICALVRDIAAENYTDFEEHGIEPVICIPDDAIIINGDKNELKRAVSNLIINIYKHNPDGIKAEIAVRREGETAVITISDSGEPIPAKMDIFEPFVTENAARTAGHGSGLGLAITKRIIERHKGAIAVINSEGVYSKTFEIRL